MGILLSATEISEKITYYRTISIILGVTTIVFTIAAIIIWFRLGVFHSIKVLLGMGIDKEIQKISEDTKLGNTYSKQSHSKATLSWNTSGLLRHDEEETCLLDTDETQLLDEGTTLLEPINSDDFEIEEEIIMTGKGN